MISSLLWGTVGIAQAGTTYFDVTDTPGYWFDRGAGHQIAGTRSLAVVSPGEKMMFLQQSSKFGPAGDNGPSRVESFHTVTSLIWPSNAEPGERIDQDAANKDDHEVTLNTPGLYVFVCKVHPYMLAGVVVDSAATPGGLDMGDNLHLLGVGDFPTAVQPAGSSEFVPVNLALRLLRAFFIVTSPSNWKDYTKVGSKYQPTYPAVPVVLAGGLVVPDLNAALQATFDGEVIPPQQKPRTKGIGQVWVDTQYELTAGKGDAYPGTISVVSATSWNVQRKIALPQQKMNNGHNMWASHDQKQIYQTEWHGKSLYVLNRHTGKLIQEIVIGEDPAHVMTRVDTEQVHVPLNGEDSVTELNRVPSGLLAFNRQISMQDPNNPTKPTQPHAHWMGFDGQTMATPNANTNDSTLFNFWANFGEGAVVAKNQTGPLPIAASMMPDSSKYYVSNYLGHSTSVIDMTTNPPTKIKDINLLQHYNPVTGEITGPIGGLPIQTPVSPDGKFVITGNTLTGTITIIDTKTDTLVKSLICDPGCHGVNFGAKKGGGYYAYVTSKFANRLIVLDYDPNNDGNADDAVIAGWVILANDNVPKDDKIIGNKGQGGQGVLPVPNVYNGWVQQLPIGYKAQLTREQRNPLAPLPGRNPHDEKGH
jgi:DNA-binding beta-propeller fold protein YncE